MIISRRDDRRVTYLSVLGDLDVLDAVELRDAGLSALTPECATLRIDLSGVTFVDSSGLAALIDIRNDALVAHELVLQDVSPRVRQVLTLSGLDSVFAIE